MDELENEVGLVFPCTVIRSCPLLNYLEKEKCAFVLKRVGYVLIFNSTSSTLGGEHCEHYTLLGVYMFCILSFRKEKIAYY